MKEPRLTGSPVIDIRALENAPVRSDNRLRCAHGDAPRDGAVWLGPIAIVRSTGAGAGAHRAMPSVIARASGRT